MGLDMYLYAQTPVEAYVPVGPVDYEEDGHAWQYISGWEHSAKDSRTHYDQLLEAFSLPRDICPGSPHIMAEQKPVKVGEKEMPTWVLGVTVAYWRKANAIHAWFVDSCQGGVDECQYSDPIPREKLLELRDLSQQALEAYRSGELDKARDLLTPRSGFFFGSYEIDEWYAKDLEDTVSQIDRALAVCGDRFAFVYRSSW